MAKYIRAPTIFYNTDINYKKNPLFIGAVLKRNISTEEKKLLVNSSYLYVTKEREWRCVWKKKLMDFISKNN